MSNIQHLYDNVGRLVVVTEALLDSATKSQWRSVVALSCSVISFCIIGAHAALVESDWSEAPLLVLGVFTLILAGTVPYFVKAARRTTDLAIRYQLIMEDLEHEMKSHPRRRITDRPYFIQPMQKQYTPEIPQRR